jgi:hypothetical protein
MLDSVHNVHTLSKWADIYVGGLRESGWLNRKLKNIKKLLNLVTLIFTGLMPQNIQSKFNINIFQRM